MGQEVRGVPAPPEVDAGIGRYLAGQRRLRGISLEELAALTRIPRRSLERLEAGAFDAETDGFVRGFVRTVSAALGLDPDEAVMRLMREPDADEAGRGGHSRRRALLGRVAAAAGLVLVLVGLGRLLAGLLAPAPASEAPPLVLRRDPVRALVQEGAEPPQSPAP